jgi:hypothetical protein
LAEPLSRPRFQQIWRAWMAHVLLAGEYGHACANLAANCCRRSPACTTTLRQSLSAMARRLVVGAGRPGGGTVCAQDAALDHAGAGAGAVFVAAW